MTKLQRSLTHIQCLQVLAIRQLLRLSPLHLVLSDSETRQFLREVLPQIVTRTLRTVRNPRSSRSLVDSASGLLVRLLAELLGDKRFGTDFE